MTSHIGLVFVCNSSTTLIPPGFLQRVKVRVRQDIGPRSSPIWQKGIICADAGAQGIIRISKNSRSIYVHVRSTASGRKDARRLLQRILKVFHIVCEFSSGLQLDVEHCCSDDLTSYVEEPESFAQQDVINSRMRSLKVVHSIDGRIDSLGQLLGFDDSSSLS